MSTKPTNETRRQVLHRDGFKCAICGQPIDTGWSGYSIHHRRMRSQGHGYDNLHEPGNLLTLCGSGTTGCHGWVHAHPARAYRLGYLVHMGKDPATIPVYYRTVGWQQLNADGTRTPAEPPSDQPGYHPRHQTPERLPTMISYHEFLKRKRDTEPPDGIDVPEGTLHPRLFDWQKRIVSWALKVGRAAIWADTGLGKTMMQLEWARRFDGRRLVVAPLAVCEQTCREARKLDLTATYVRTPDEITGDGVWVTNYERVESFPATCSTRSSWTRRRSSNNPPARPAPC